MSSKGIALFFSIVMILIMSCSGMAEEPHGRHQTTAAGSANPLIEEMTRLDAAFRDIVSAVAVGNGADVHRALETLHGTMEKTHEGVHQGVVKLARNADHLHDFLMQDRQFHARLEMLDAAAQKNDQGEMLRFTKDLLNRCVHCHRLFKTP